MNCMCFKIVPLDTVDMIEFGDKITNLALQINKKAKLISDASTASYATKPGTVTKFTVSSDKPEESLAFLIATPQYNAQKSHLQLPWIEKENTEYFVGIKVTKNPTELIILAPKDANHTELLTVASPEFSQSSEVAKTHPNLLKDGGETTLFLAIKRTSEGYSLGQKVVALWTDKEQMGALLPLGVNGIKTFSPRTIAEASGSLNVVMLVALIVGAIIIILILWMVFRSYKGRVQQQSVNAQTIARMLN